MANKDTILTIYDSDIISESMHKINYNFELLLNKDDVSDWKLSKLEQKINNELENIRRTSDERAGGLSRELDDLQELLEGLHSHEEIQAMVESAIRNAESSLRGFIASMAGEQISEMIDGFAKTADLRNLQSQIDTLNGKIEGLDGGGNQGGDEYVSSQAFTRYKSEAERKVASANMMAANSTFKKDANGYYILFNDDPSQPESPSDFQSLVDYYQYLRSTENFDPNGLGLSDPDICKAFLAKCETYFQSVFTELAQFQASVSEGEAVAEVLASVRDDENNTLVAAIFARARKEGTEITLTADNIELDASKIFMNAENIIMSAEHRLALVTGGFSINSENLIVDTDGNVSMTGDLFANTFRTNNGKTSIDTNGVLTTEDAKINGDIVANSFKTASNMTFMNSDGVLHASNAVIDGDISANRFLAEWSEDVNEDGVTGHLKKSTLIDGQSFNIGVSGTLNVGNDTTFDTSRNSLYIKIANTLPNTQGTSGYNEDFGNTLYGVPVLCMMYNGEEYMLTPASWFKPGVGGGDTSNMRFMYRYRAVHCSFNGASSELRNYYIQNTMSLNDGNNSVVTTTYIFRPNIVKSGKTFITMGTNNGQLLADSVYQFEVINWGTDGMGTKNTMLNEGSKPLLSNVSTSTGVYTLESVLGSNGLGYANEGGITNINENNRDNMINYLPKVNNYTLGIKFSKSLDSNDEYNATLPTEFGVDKIGQLMLRLIKTSSGNTIYSNSGLWKTNAFGIAKFGFNNGRSDDCFLGSGNGQTGNDLNSNLPFESNGYTSYHFNLNYYPICKLESYGRTHSEGINYVIGTCEMQMFKRYNDNISLSTVYNGSIDYTIYTQDDNYNWHAPDPVNFNVNEMELKLEFNFALNFNSTYYNYDPRDSSTYKNIEQIIINFLTNYDYSNNNINLSGFANKVKLSGKIKGNNDIVVELQDNLR